jgi:hypothetical protein
MATVEIAIYSPSRRCPNRQALDLWASCVRELSRWISAATRRLVFKIVISFGFHVRIVYEAIFGIPNSIVWT